jgi:predicted Zn-dependent protease
MKRVIPFLILLLLISFTGCKKKKGEPGQPLFLTAEDDIQLGQKLKAEIEANPQQYPILDRTQYRQAYAILDTIINTILNSGKVRYRNQFAWEFYIIRDDSTLNAFCAPGGYIYVYTGLIKYLDSEDDLAGVLGHEIAHADLRHTSRQLEKVYGLSLLLQIIAGQNAQMLQQIALNLAALQFSRDHETEADLWSVEYLCPTEYDAAGAAHFFEALIAAGNAGWIPEFLSTHPSPENRIQNIHNKKAELRCSGTATYVDRYQRLKNALP